MTRLFRAPAFTRGAPFYARYTLRHHLPAEVLLGLFSGVWMLADLLTRKTLGASKEVLAVQTSVPTMMLLLAMVWRDLLEEKSRRRVLLLTGLCSKGLLVSVAFIASPGPFLAIVMLFAVVDSAFIPLRNAIFRANYDESVRGRFFGGVVSLANVCLVLSNLVAAWLLDRWEWTYRILFPVAGVIGFGAHAIYARVRVRGEGGVAVAPEPPARRKGPLAPLGRALRTTVRILKDDPQYRAYEIGFFIYGLAFLMNLPLVVLLIVDELGLAYGEAAFARFIIAQMMMILLAPLAGRLLDKSHPARLMGWSCVLLAVHAGLLAVTFNVETLAASYLIFGVAMTAVVLGWNIGPVQFAKREQEAADYMAVHVTLTGLRAVIGPAIALCAEHYLSLRHGFFISCLLYGVAAVVMARLSDRVRRERGGAPGVG
jgi:MFS family permease